jgi:hypothetical protein
MLLFAVGQFHKTNDLKTAQDYLETKINKNFKAVSDLSKYVLWLQTYVREFGALGNNFVQVRDNVTLPLPSRFSKIVVSGQAARIDLNPAGGYAVWIFARNSPTWEKDPRMPLLQQAYATKLGVSLQDIEVGIYDFVVGRHFRTNYSEAQVRRPQRSLWKLLLLIQRKISP